MGTNYYVPHKPPCPTCGLGSEDLHIGKSSMGWRFMFREYPEHGLTTWPAWKAFLVGRMIIDEYGQAHTLDALISLIESKQDGQTSSHNRIDDDGFSFSRGEFC
jgi:hypothetical protein